MGTPARLSLALMGSWFAATALAQPSERAYEPLLSTDAIGVNRLSAAQPLADGRGVVIAILDTGVDAASAGLRHTSTGDRKLLLVRDFSGQGKLTLAEPELATVDGRAALKTADGWVWGFEAALAGRPVSEARVAFLREEQMSGSAVADLNANGRHDDVFAILVVPEPAPPGGTGVAPRWRAYLDLDANRDLTGATGVLSFEHEWHALALRGRDPQRAESPLSLSLYLDPEGEHVEVCFDDGGHGTHVAGIAAGASLHDRPGFDGIAPGAQLISLKIGHNALAGGATTTGAKERAVEFAAQWAKEQGRPVVINLSYGIGSEVEGDADVDTLFTDALRKTPELLYAAASAGNSGPGLSTMGQPAASELVFTAGALLTRDNARGLYGVDPGRDTVFVFSSRGGDTAKPDALLPGVAWSSVPPFLSRSVMQGTSMASPQAAGALARLVGAAQAAGLTVNNGMVRRALRYGARTLAEYDALDQGSGVVDLGASWTSLRALARSQEARQVLGYRLQTAAPTSPTGKAPGAYWRVGGHAPPASRPETVEVTPIFAGEPEANDKAAFFTTLSLRSTAPWLRLPASRLNLRGGEASRFEYSVDVSGLKRPGAYVAEILAVPNESGLGERQAAFSLPVTVVVPERPSDRPDWRQGWGARSLRPGEIARHFVHVPAHASGLALRARLVGGGAGQLWARVFDPDGRGHRVDGAVADSATGGDIDVNLSAPTLEPGTWEVVFYASYRNPGPVRFESEALLYGLHAGPVEGFTVPTGGAPDGAISVRNARPEPFFGTASGELDGFARTFTLESDADPSFVRHTFTTGADTRAVHFRLELDPFSYARFTDVAITVQDRSGAQVAKGGFSQRKAVFSFSPSDPGTYVLEIQAAHTASDPEEGFSVRAEERFVTRDRIGVTTTLRSERDLALYPDRSEDLDLKLSGRPRQVPDGYVLSGELRFVDGRGALWLAHPLRIDP